MILAKTADFESLTPGGRSHLVRVLRSLYSRVNLPWCHEGHATTMFLFTSNSLTSYLGTSNPVMGDVKSTMLALIKTRSTASTERARI